MKQKPRWMRSVIEAAKAECETRSFGRAASILKTRGDKRPKSETAKP